MKTIFHEYVHSTEKLKSVDRGENATEDLEEDLDNLDKANELTPIDVKQQKKEE